MNLNKPSGMMVAESIPGRVSMGDVVLQHYFHGRVDAMVMVDIVIVQKYFVVYFFVFIKNKKNRKSFH